MTAVEIGTMFVCALAWEGGLAAMLAAPPRGRRGGGDARRRAELPRAAGLRDRAEPGHGLRRAAARGNYPVKVAFKSCKLVPTMAFSRYIVRDGKRYGVDDYAAALFMCVGLALLSAADLAAHAERDTQAAGLMLLIVAVCSDAVIPNLQEKLLRGLKLPLGSMVVLSNAGSFLVVLAFIAATGELGRAVAYLRVHQDAAAWLLAQGLVGYAGLRCYLNVIRGLSGVAGVLATSARKVVTLVLSFILAQEAVHGLARDGARRARRRRRPRHPREAPQAAVTRVCFKMCNAQSNAARAPRKTGFPVCRLRKKRYFRGVRAGRTQIRSRTHPLLIGVGCTRNEERYSCCTAYSKHSQKKSRRRTHRSQHAMTSLQETANSQENAAKMSADDIERALDSGPFATWAQPLAALAAAVAEAKPARVVSPAEFLRRCVDGGARCVDVRSPAEFARDAVPGPTRRRCSTTRNAPTLASATPRRAATRRCGSASRSCARRAASASSRSASRATRR